MREVEEERKRWERRMLDECRENEEEWMDECNREITKRKLKSLR